MKPRTDGKGSEQSLTLRRSKSVASGERARMPSPGERAQAQEDPERGDGGRSARVPATGAGVLRSGDETKSQDLPISHYKGVSLARVGRDSSGRVIQHKYSAHTAEQVALWVAGGYDANAICIMLNMRPGVLKELYGKEIQMGVEKIGMEFSSNLYRRAKKSDRLAIFFAKAKLGWRDGESAQNNQSLLNIHIHE